VAFLFWSGVVLSKGWPLRGATTGRQGSFLTAADLVLLVQMLMSVQTRPTHRATPPLRARILKAASSVCAPTPMCWLRTGGPV
jgi:hypothetical protein